MQPGSVAAVIVRIRSFAKARNMSRNQLAIAAGIAPNTLKGLFDDDWNPTADTLRKLEDLIPADFVTGAAA